MSIKLDKIKIGVDDRGRVFIGDVNKRGQFRNKKDVTKEIDKYIVKYFDDSILTVEGKKYMCVVREMGKEQVVIHKKLKDKRNAAANQEYVDINRYLKKLFRIGSYHA